MNRFEQALEAVLGIEDGFSDNPADSGGKTRFGITEALARAHGYTGDMREFPLEMAKAIYRSDFWDRMRLDDVAEVSPMIAEEMFDCAVNCGVEVAVQFLQRALNVMNRRGRDYADITVDGQVGPGTIAALRGYMNHRRADNGEVVLFHALNDLQGARYIRLAEQREKDEDFVFGWIKNRVA